MKVSALFIGNSFTSENDLPKTVSLIAKSLGDRLDYDMSAPGGFSLMQHATDKGTIGKIQSKPWDFVILQDQSLIPAMADSYTNTYVLPYASQLNDLIHQARINTRTMFFETWGYKNGDADDCAGDPGVCSYSGMQARLRTTYEKMAQSTGGDMAPVGEAWSYAKEYYPDIELYQSDGKHPSPEGTYLAACVFYTKLFNKPVVGASRLAISPTHAATLQDIAQKIVSSK